MGEHFDQLLAQVQRDRILHFLRLSSMLLWPYLRYRTFLSVGRASNCSVLYLCHCQLCHRYVQRGILLQAAQAAIHPLGPNKSELS